MLLLDQRSRSRRASKNFLFIRAIPVKPDRRIFSASMIAWCLFSSAVHCLWSTPPACTMEKKTRFTGKGSHGWETACERVSLRAKDGGGGTCEAKVSRLTSLEHTLTALRLRASITRCSGSSVPARREMRICLGLKKIGGRSGSAEVQVWHHRMIGRHVKLAWPVTMEPSSSAGRYRLDQACCILLCLLSNDCSLRSVQQVSHWTIRSTCDTAHVETAC